MLAGLLVGPRKGSGQRDRRLGQRSWRRAEQTQVLHRSRHLFVDAREGIGQEERLAHDVAAVAVIGPLYALLASRRGDLRGKQVSSNTVDGHDRHQRAEGRLAVAASASGLLCEGLER